MKVLHINSNYINSALHEKMIEALREQGINNTVFVPTHYNHSDIISDTKDILIKECFNKWDRINFRNKQKKIIQCLEREINISKYDFIQAYTIFTDGNCAKQISEKYKIPYIVTVRNTDINYFFKYRRDLKDRAIIILRDASAILFLSETYKDQLFKKYIPDKLSVAFLKKAYIIPNGIDDFWLDDKKCNINGDKLDRIRQKKLKLIYVGRIDSNKNIPTTQKAMNILLKKGYQVELTIVGKIDNKKVFKKIVKNPYTKYVSEKPKEQIEQLLLEHDIFVMPSFTETFGLVYAEAMSRGLPIIYTQNQGFDRQFKEGDVGFHVKANSPKQIAEAIEKIIMNYEKISRNCLLLCERFDWHKIGMKYKSLYAKVWK